MFLFTIIGAIVVLALALVGAVFTAAVVWEAFCKA